MVEPIIAAPVAMPADFSNARRLKDERELSVDLNDVLTSALFKLDSDVVIRRWQARLRCFCAGKFCIHNF
jgi:hypothetical protein